MSSRPLALLPLLLAAGCADVLDPVGRDGAWRPMGANAQNLRAMVAEPHELRWGSGAPGTDGQQATDAVERLRADRVRRLPDSTVVQIGTGAQ